MTVAIEKLARKVGETLIKQGMKLVTAESCTGGGLSYWITSVSGSSDWFERGYVTYSNEAKVELLGVNPLTLESYGAVDAFTAREMAEGALRHSHADISIAITGIAGPTGGSTLKPVGTVWIAYARRNAPTQAFEDVYKGNRQKIRMLVIERALENLLSQLR